MESDPAAEHELDHVSVQEQGAELVLQQAEAHQTTDVAESIQTLGGGPTLDRRVETSFSRRIEKRSVVISALFRTWRRLLAIFGRSGFLAITSASAEIENVQLGQVLGGGERGGW